MATYQCTTDSIGVTFLLFGPRVSGKHDHRPVPGPNLGRKDDERGRGEWERRGRGRRTRVGLRLREIEGSDNTVEGPTTGIKVAVDGI